jgi:hypothetical protein
MRAIIPLLVASFVLAGCSVGADESNWWTQGGVQCEQPDWLVAADGPGMPADKPTEPYERHAYREAKLKAWFEGQGKTVHEAFAYLDDRMYPAACGFANGWHYAVRLAEGESAGEGWHQGEKPELRPNPEPVDAGDEQPDRLAARWFSYPDRQCEERPWKAFVNESLPQAKQAYAHSPREEDALQRYFEARGVEPIAVAAYFQDGGVAAVCGGHSGWHFHVRVRPDDEGALQGWEPGNPPDERLE